MLKNQASDPMTCAAFEGLPPLRAPLIALGTAHARHGIGHMLDTSKHRNPRRERVGLEENWRQIANCVPTSTRHKAHEQPLQIHQGNREGFVFEFACLDAGFAQKCIGRAVAFRKHQRAAKGFRDHAAREPGWIAEAIQTTPRMLLRSSRVTFVSIRGPRHVESIPSPLEGAVVQKVRLGIDRLALDLRVPGRSTWVEIRTTTGGLRMRGGEGKSEPLPLCPDATLVRYARKYLEGARFAAASPSHVDFLTPEGLVRMSLQGKAGRFIPRFSPCALAEGKLPSESELRDEAAKVAIDPQRDPVSRDRQDLMRSIEREKKRTERTLAAVRDDAAAIEKARADAGKARFLVVAAKRAVAGTTELVAESGVDDVEPVRLRIDPRIAPQVALERVFARAKRLVARRAFVDARMTSLTEALETFRVLHTQATSASDSAALHELRETFRGLARRASTTAADRTREGGSRAPYKTFVGAGGREILVGRSSAKNHDLTFRVAKGSDLWLHAREVEGAHVVVRLRRDEQMPPELLLDAAHLAVYFSRSREENLVDVQYTPVGQLKKLPTPGAVILTREKVIAVRVDHAHTQELLATER